MTEDKEYPICELPESLLIPSDDQQSYLTYIYPRDITNNYNQIHNKFSQSEKIIFYSTLKQLYNEQRITIDLLEGNKPIIHNIQYRFIEDCNFPPLQNTENPTHCIKFQLAYAANRAHKDSGHKKVSIDYSAGIIQEYDTSNKHFNFHKINPNELLFAISLNAHDFEGKNNPKNKLKFFGSLREFIGLETNLEELQNDENIDILAASIGDPQDQTMVLMQYF